MKQLTESEVAEILRCSPSKIKRLRLSRKLGYTPGRPVTIGEDDLKIYLERIKCRPTPCDNMTTESSISTGPKIDVQSVIARARRKQLRRRFTLARGSKAK